MFWEAGGLRLSGADAVPAGAPRATIMAIHGGGYSAGYWDHPLDPGASLMRLGPALGYRVVAIDRPGYGASHGITGADARMAHQAEVVLDLIDVLRAGGETGAGVFLIGHSLGAVLTLHIAAAAGSGAIAGADISGLPFLMDARPDQGSAEQPDAMPPLPKEVRRAVFFGPDATFDPRILDAEEAMVRPIPAAEVIDGYECEEAAPVLAAKITVPMQITRAEFEATSGGGRPGLERLGALFTASRRVELVWQRGSGHNISLHHLARAYHLRAIAFFDEVLARA